MPEDDDWIIPPPPPPMRPQIPDGFREVVLWSAHLELLKQVDFPGSERLLASAKKLGLDDLGGEGDVLLLGRIEDIKRLAGFVAGEANHYDRHHRRSRLARVWAEIADRVESAAW